MQLTKILLVGKPNSGKTSLFNQLTGLNQKVGNFAGVTVERKSGKLEDCDIIDLPGLNSLYTTSPEEEVSKTEILKATSDTPILFVANGMHIRESLMLFSEIADLQKPMALVINFKDELHKYEQTIDINKLSSLVGCTVHCISSKDDDDVSNLKTTLLKSKFEVPNAFLRSTYDNVTTEEITNSYQSTLAANTLSQTPEKEYELRQQKVVQMLNNTTSTQQQNNYLSTSQRIDKYLLHPVWGSLFFLFTMYLMFQAVFTLSAYPMDWIDAGMSSLAEWAGSIDIPWLSTFLSEALIPGIGGVVIFVPQIALLFLLIGILEHTGYLSRVSLISDVLLKKFGLSGHSTVPLVSSLACAIPAIMSTRIINNPRERFAAMMAIPLMTCSARLPVYAMLIALIFPVGNSPSGVQGLVLLSLYLLGFVATLFVSWLVSRSQPKADNDYWMLELPIYRTPNWKNIIINVYQKAKSFVVEAGKIILIASIILWVLGKFSPRSEAYIDQQHQLAKTEIGTDISRDAIALEHSYLGYLGKGIEPVIRPLGYDWKIGIALISSFAAREVFVGTLSTIYSIGSDDENSIVERLRTEKNHRTNRLTFNVATSVSLLLFYVFAMQCLSTLAIVRRETGSWKYPILQFVGMTALAYVAALVGYLVLS